MEQSGPVMHKQYITDLIHSGYNFSASMPEADVNSVAPENRARPDGDTGC